VWLCGELAGEPMASPILLGLGLDEFSMSPTRIPVIKQIMQRLHRGACEELAEAVLQLVDAEEVMEKSRSFLTELGLALK
jgi:phosphotransferase system enzyme I (PtsI)